MNLLRSIGPAVVNSAHGSAHKSLKAKIDRDSSVTKSSSNHFTESWAESAVKNGKHPTKEAAISSLICRKCGGKRHLERDCRKGSKGPPPNKTTKSTYPKKNADKGKKGRVHLTNANEEDYGEDQEDAINGMMKYGYYCRQSHGQLEKVYAEPLQ